MFLTGALFADTYSPAFMLGELRADKRPHPCSGISASGTCVHDELLPVWYKDLTQDQLSFQTEENYSPQVETVNISPHYKTICFGHSRHVSCSEKSKEKRFSSPCESNLFFQTLIFIPAKVVWAFFMKSNDTLSEFQFRRLIGLSYQVCTQQSQRLNAKQSWQMQTAHFHFHLQ